MSTRSKAELIDEVLELLGILGAGQPAEIEDTARVNELLPSVQPYLAAQEIAYIPDFNTIPEAVFIPLTAMTAYCCRSKFGIAGDDEIALTKANTEAITAMKVIFRARPTGQPLQTEYI